MLKILFSNRAGLPDSLYCVIFLELFKFVSNNYLMLNHVIFITRTILGLTFFNQARMQQYFSFFLSFFFLFFFLSFFLLWFVSTFLFLSIFSTSLFFCFTEAILTITFNIYRRFSRSMQVGGLGLI